MIMLMMKIFQIEEKTESNNRMKEERNLKEEGTRDLNNVSESIDNRSRREFPDVSSSDKGSREQKGQCCTETARGKVGKFILDANSCFI